VRWTKWAFLVLCMSLMSQVSFADDSVLRLDLDESVRIALAQNPQIKQIMARLNIADERVQVASAPARLSVDFQGGAARVQPAQTPTVQVSVDGVESDFQQSSNFGYNVFEGTINIQKLLFDGGQVRNQIAAAQLSADSTHLAALDTWRRLHLQIEAAYITVLRAEESVQNALASRDLAKTTLSTAETRFAVGQVPRGDIVFAQVPLAQAELEVERSLFQRQSAREALLLLLGLPQRTPLEVNKLSPREELNLTRESALEHALAERADLQASLLELEAADKNLKAVSRGRRPSLALASSINPVGFDGNQLASGGYRVGLVLRWPILAGNVVEHQTRIAEAQQAEIVAGIELKKQTIEREVREAFRAVELARLSKDSTTLQVQRAAESLRIAQGQYNAGLAQFNVVNEQQRELVRAQGAQTQATYDYMLARARLDQVIGRKVLQENPFETTSFRPIPVA
jgi:outer membrane protein TolC